MNPRELFNCQIGRCWNSGCTLTEAVKICSRKGFGYEDVASAWEYLTMRYGDAPIPLADVIGKRPVTDPIRRAHLGLDGPGAALRGIIQAMRQETNTSVSLY